ncbi:MAG TPA: DNA polymerase III subunit beta [Patescibacteria group bacterium]|nr:DNA polymerase III subunit beta [Patescibacteria group bacterium]
MKIECTQGNLQRGLGLVSRMVGTRTTLPVLANVLLKTEKGRLRLSATNLEMGISTYVGGKVGEEGSVTLPAKLLAEFIATNTDQTITIETRDDDATLKSAHYNASIKGIAASEFPAIPEITAELEFEVASSELKSAITQTVFAAAVDETRPVLAGILVKISGNTLKLVATDSFRLAEKVLMLDKKVSRDTDVIIPARTMIEVVRLLEEGNDRMRVRLGENQAAFSMGDTYLISRVVEGSFPDYEQIIPKELPIKSSLTRTELVNAMKMSTLFARDAANNIKLKIFSKQIEVLATSPQLGENKSLVPAETKGSELEIAFNARYILDALLVLSGDKIELDFVGKLNPCVLKDPSDKTFQYIIMPLRVET